MFRKPISLVGVDGSLERTCNVSDLRNLPIAELQQYLANATKVSATHQAFVASQETMLTNLFMYPSVEAMRNSMKEYADGSVQKKIDHLNNTVAALGSSIRGQAKVERTPEDVEGTNSFIQIATPCASNYLECVSLAEKFARQEKILRAVIAEKQAANNESNLSPRH